MRGGSLRHYVTIERQDDNPRNDYGERPMAWTPIATIRCSIETVKGREYMAASGENAELTHRIRCRNSPELAQVRPRDRAVFGQRIFDIKSVIATTDKCRGQVEIMAVEALRD